MRTQTLVITLLLLCTNGVLAQKTITGKITDKNDIPLVGAGILVKGTTIGVVTGLDGRFQLTVPEGSEVLVISYTGFNTYEVEIGSRNELNIQLLDDGIKLSHVIATSPISFWYGAEATYNFTGASDFENFIGSAPIKIGQYHLGDSKQSKFGLFLVGNIANLVSNQSEELEKDASKLAQSGRGLSIGLSPVYTIKEFEIGGRPAAFRSFLTAFFNYNVFRLDSTDVSPKTDPTLNFSQFGLNLGFELEGLYLQNDNKPSTLYLNIYRNQFDRNKFAILEGKPENNIFGIEAGIILALPGLPIGFKSSFNTSNQFNGFWNVGMVIKNNLK